MKLKYILILALLTFQSKEGSSQENLKQTLRGIVIDRDTQIPLPGVNIILPETSPQQGTISDDKGFFRCSKHRIILWQTYH